LLVINEMNGEIVSELTVGDLRRALARFNDDDILHLPGNLTFYRIKAWGDDQAVFEVSEPLADLSPEFRKDHPNVSCAFISLSPMDDDDMVSGPVGITV
jgi:hypothetical protein